jgi:hypothetical protein
MSYRNMTTMPREDSGVALLLALLAMALVGGIAHRLMLHADAYRAMTQTVSDSITIQQRLREGLNLLPARSRSCSEQRVSSGVKTRQWLVCSHGNPAFISNRPFSLPDGRVDYNSLFANPSGCPGLRGSNSEQFAASPSSGFSCELPPRLAQNLIVLENIRCRDLVMESAERGKSLTIATPGSLTCDGLVTVSAHTLVIAGGDLRIAALKSASPTPIAITLLSAHGAIVVGNTTGLLSVLALGRDLLNIPITQEHSTFLLPPFTTSSIAGVKLLD